MGEPAYKRVYNSIRSQITGKQYNIGSILPPEPELEKEFAVSRTTVRKAIEMLVRDGFLSVRQGFGTQVISRKAVQNLNKFSSISESLAKGGRQIGLRSCYIERIGATEEIATLLGVAVRTPLICVHRIKMSDGKPICLIKNYILEQIVPGMDLDQQIAHLYSYLKENYGITYTGSRDTISACNATFEMAQLLEIRPMEALLSVRRVCYMGTRPCEVDVVNIIADLYEYEVFVGDEHI